MDERLQDIASSYIGRDSLISVRPLGRGNINDTYLVNTTGQAFVLQRINGDVFPCPQHLIHNLELISEHLQKKRSRGDYLLRPPITLPTRGGQSAYIDTEGDYWRATLFIPEGRTLKNIENLKQVASIGWALAHFHRSINDLQPELLIPPLPGFHHLPSYLQHYDNVLGETSIQAESQGHYCQTMINNYREKASFFEDGLASGTFHLVPTHGDPKVDNFLFSTEDDTPLALIDLDTTGAGLIVYDIGDCLRSVCNPVEHFYENGQVEIDLQLCTTLISSYLNEHNGFLPKNDQRHIIDGFELVCFELGLRFFTDYLLNNVYFKTSFPKHNLLRAVGQFKLLESIGRNESKLRKITQ